MSDIYFKCECGKSLAVDEAGIGRVVSCVDCGKPVLVPDPELEFDCEGCGERLLAPWSIAGDRIKCASCGHRMLVPGVIESEGVHADVGRDCIPASPSSPARVMNDFMRSRSGFIIRRRPAQRTGWERIGTELQHWLLRAAAVFALLVLARELMRDVFRDEMPEDEAIVMSLHEEQQADTEIGVVSGTMAQGEAVEPDPMPDAAPAPTVLVASVQPAMRGVEIHVRPEAAIKLPEVSVEIEDAGLPDAFVEQQVEIPDYSGLTTELLPYIRKAGLLGAASGAPEKLREAREKLLDCTRRYGRTHVLDAEKWECPIDTCYEWSLRHGIGSHAESAAAVREVFETLQSVSPANAASAASVATSIALIYSELWMDTHAVETIRLADEIEEWVLAQPGGRNSWYWRMRYAQASFLLQEKQFPEDKRDWLWRSRQERLSARIDEEVMGLTQRTDTLTSWCRALYLAGRGEEAWVLMSEWVKKHGRQINSARFLEWRMRLALFEKADWEAAGNVLAEANLQQDIWDRRPSEQRSYAALSEMYYDCINLAEYELKRARSEEKKIVTRRLDPVRTISGGMR